MDSSYCGLLRHGPWCATQHARNSPERSQATRELREWQRKLQSRSPENCVLFAHGPWCAYSIHPPPKTTPDPTRVFNSSVSVSSGLEAPSQFGLVNLALSEEISALNAIFGSGTLQVVDATDEKSRLRLELPIGECANFWMSFSSDYPLSVPEIQQVSLSLHQSTDRRVQNIFLIVFTVLQDVFNSGFVCLFDLIDHALPIIACLKDHEFDPDAAAQTLPSTTDLKRWQWTKKPFIDMNTARSKQNCVICCEELYAFEMISVACNHFFCFECFATGWKIARDEAQPYTCCLRNIPLETVREFLTVSNEEVYRYRRLRLETSTSDAFFCGNKVCGHLVGTFTKWQLSRGEVKRIGIMCSHCRWRTCVGCRELKHGGACVEDAALKELISQFKVRRCEKCGAAIEKDGGCAHMKCRVCGTDAWWTVDGALTPWSRS